VPHIEQRFDSKAVARGKDGAASLVPQHKGELAAQPVQALRTKILIKMQGELAIRARAQSMTGCLELALDRLVAIELAIDHDARVTVFAGDRLIARQDR
jgi:hypothetical protein